MNDRAANQANATRPVPMDRRLWLWWVLAGLLGWGVGGPLGVALGTPGNIIENGFMSISFGGILMGVLQWLALRRRLAPAGWWAPAGILAAVVFGAIVFGGLVLDPGGTWITDVTWIVGAALFMPLAAFLQWRLVLRRHLPRGAGWWWVPASLVAFLASGVGSALATVPMGLTGKEGGVDAIVVWTVFGAVFGALTGLVLVRLSRRGAPGAPMGAA